MHWNDLPLVCFTLSTLLCLLGRRWLDAFVSACFAACLVLDRLQPSALPQGLKWMFALAGAIVVVSRVMNEYRRYKKNLAARSST